MADDRVMDHDMLFFQHARQLRIQLLLKQLASFAVDEVASLVARTFEAGN